MFSWIDPKERGYKEKLLYAFEGGDLCIFEYETYRDEARWLQWFMLREGQLHRLVFMAKGTCMRQFAQGLLTWHQQDERAKWQDGETV